MRKLEGKCALVTGAARGIGAGIAQAFAAEGATVIVTDINLAQGRKVARQIGGTFFKLDVRKEADWQRFEARFPRMDIVVNNAGVTGLEGEARPHDPEHASLSGWRAVHETNLDGTFLGCRYALRAMRQKREGAIINISSRSGMVGVPLAAAYASSKAAIRNHTKSVALYAAGEGLNIRCNSIHPAAIMTPMWEPMLGEGEDRVSREAQIVSTTPMRRFGAVEEVAALAVLLASDDCAYMTGAELSVDGGIMAG
jgi:3(or 17)beta-hydroxysteroid dehydrogenase